MVKQSVSVTGVQNESGCATKDQQIESKNSLIQNSSTIQSCDHAAVISAKATELQNYEVSIKSQLLFLLDKWRQVREGKKIANYHGQVHEALRMSGFDPVKVNRDTFAVMRKKHGWSERHIWPVTAWNDFCRFGMSVQPGLLSDSHLIEKPKRIAATGLPAKMQQEIQSIMDAHIVRSTAAKLKKQSQEHIFTSFEAFRHFVLQNEPSRIVESLSDFIEKDALGFKDTLIKTGLSPLTGQSVSLNTLSSFLIDIRRIYKMGLAQKKVASNIFRDIPIEKHKTGKREFCLTKEQVEKLRTVNADKLEKMSLPVRFEQVRDNAMVSAQYEAALRADEVVILCWEDMPQHERSKTNVGPVIVMGAKARPDNHEDRVYILLDRLDYDLYHWKKISEDYCRVNKITPPTIVRNGKVCHPIFFSRRGNVLTTGTYISSVFSNQLRKAGITLPKGYKTHIIRHSRITHWVDDGYPFEKVHENARHSDLEQTWQYFHSNAKKRIEAVEKVEKLDEESRNLKISLLPEKGVLRMMVETIINYIKANMESLSSDQPTAVVHLAIEKILKGKCTDYVEENLYYTFREVVDRWHLSRTQTYLRIKTVTEQGLLHPVVGKSGKQIYLREEVEQIASLVDSRKASAAFGYKEKVPTTIPGLANKGIIKSTKIGKLHFFEPSELVEHYSEKNSK